MRLDESKVVLLCVVVSKRGLDLKRRKPGSLLPRDREEAIHNIVRSINVSQTVSCIVDVLTGHFFEL